MRFRYLQPLHHDVLFVIADNISNALGRRRPVRPSRSLQLLSNEFDQLFWFYRFDGIIIYLLPDGLQRRLKVWVASQYYCHRLGPAPPVALATVKPSPGCPMLRSESSMSNCRLLMMPSASPTLLARVTSKPLCVRIMPTSLGSRFHRPPQGS